MPQRFRVADVLRWFATHHPDVPPSTVRTRLARATRTTGGPTTDDRGQSPLFQRLDRGLYELLPTSTTAGGTSDRSAGRAVLFAIASTVMPDDAQRRARARMFDQSKIDARRRGARWFGLSSHYGLIHDDDPSPASIVMRDVPTAHGDTWASWITIRLEAAMGSIHGAWISIDAPHQYTALLQPMLESRGAIVDVPDDRD